MKKYFSFDFICVMMEHRLFQFLQYEVQTTHPLHILAGTALVKEMHGWKNFRGPIW